MKGLRTDLVVMALLISALLHLGIMYYMRPMVMTHVAPVAQSRAKKGPMRVTTAPTYPDPVVIQSVLDVKPLKEAPEAEKDVSIAPRPDATLPVGGETKAAVPDIEMPADLTADVPPADALPAVRTTDLSPTVVPVSPTIGSSGVLKPSDIVSKVPRASDDALALPVLNLPVPVLGAAPPLRTAPGGATELLSLKPDAPAQTFKPPKEVMEKVDERVVAAEKEAVRELVDTTDAKDLMQVVDVRLSRAAAAGMTLFRVTVTPNPTLRPVPKDVVVLIDASGSIGRDRMGSIRSAAKRILRSAANTGDRFNLVAFRDRYSYAFRSWQECTESSFKAAERWLGNVAPFGRTDVFATISSVLTLPREPTRPLIALVVTDGDANSGVSNTAEILSKFSALNDGLVSVYMYGVKKSANRELIDVLTRGNRGESFIFQDEGWFSRTRAGEGLEGLSNRFRDPVLSDLRVVFATDCPAVAYPRLLRNLYLGGSVEIVGQVPAGTKEIAFSLKGLNGKEAYEGFFRLPLDRAAFDPAITGALAAERAIDNKLR